MRCLLLICERSDIMPDYNDYESLFKAINRDIQVATENVSDQIVKLWKNLVEKNFYNYDNQIYSRTWETLDSICILNIKKDSNGHITIEMGYDESKIKFYPEEDGMWNKHGEGFTSNLIEDGWNHYYKGIRTQHHGAKALEYLMKYVNSSDFKTLFSNELRKLGYTLK